MNNQYKLVQNSDKLTDFDKYYWGYQYRLGKETLVPYLLDYGAFQKGMRVAEVGSAEGGVLASFVEAGATDALGTDIVQTRMDKGAVISEIIDAPIKFLNHDIINQEILPEWDAAYDLVLLRDVIEHLDDTDIALTNIRKIIKPGGHLFVTFPPYHSPFGGHQHTVMNTGGKLPYIHLLPDKVFHQLIASGRKNDIGEVKRLQKIRLTPTKFMKAAKDSGYEIVHQDYYLLRPVFKMKFGLPSIKLTPVAKMNFIRNYFSLEAAYILKKV